jgi:hypothetical protein
MQAAKRGRRGSNAYEATTAVGAADEASAPTPIAVSPPSPSTTLRCEQRTEEGCSVNEGQEREQQQRGKGYKLETNLGCGRLAIDGREELDKELRELLPLAVQLNVQRNLHA